MLIHKVALTPMISYFQFKNILNYIYFTILNTFVSLEIVTSVTARAWIQEIKLIHIQMRWCGD